LSIRLKTLKFFLNLISEFEYTHCEKLSDAFEYLLSLMDSQGEAGQFRTLRRIIDFIVAAAFATLDILKTHDKMIVRSLQSLH